MKAKETTEFIVNWLKEYCNNANQKGFVVGVSGGIDSALSSFLAAKTGLPVLCVEMPIHQGGKQMERSFKHIAHLKNEFANVRSVEIDLSRIFDGFQKSMPEGGSESLADLASINSRARLRMTTLYYQATLHSALVVGTGNKIEDFGVGFYTKYGDGGVDLSPIADLTKTEVYLLSKNAGIIEEILKAPPTDGLWGDDRTDEDQLGATYPELEWAMTKKAQGFVNSEFKGREAEVFNIFEKLNRINQHKMVSIPVCIIPENCK